MAKGLHDHLAEEQKKIDACMKDARQKIEHAMDQAGPYTHNMITCVLQSVSKKFGYRYANDLVREFDLTDLYGIEEVN